MRRRPGADVGAAAGRFTAAFAFLAPGALVVTLLAAIGASIESVATAGTSGFFNGPNVLGIFLALSSPFLLMHPFVRERLSLTLAAVATVSSISALAAGRTGLLALVVGIAVLGIGARDLRRLLSCIAVCAVSVAIAHTWSPHIATLGNPIAVATCPAPCEVAPAAVPTGPDQVDQLFGGGREADQSRFSALVGARDEGWLEAVRLLDERPFAGHGFGTGSTLFDRYDSRERFTYFVGAFAQGVNPHNSYLQLLLELGFVVGILLLLPLLLAAGLAWKLLATVAPTDPASPSAVLSSRAS